MLMSKIFKHTLIPVAAIVAVDEKRKADDDCCVCKPSELPIYTLDIPPKKEVCIPAEPGAIEQTFGKIRQSLSAIMNEARAATVLVEDYAHQSLEYAECVLEYLQEEENTTPKYGAIAVGGVAGYILGLRGKFFRRTLYASAGALGMAALCYPKQASEYSQIGITEGKRYSTILYNFIYGVKKDDPALELPSLPKLPTTFSEAWDTAKSLGNSLKSESSVTDPKVKQKTSEQEKSTSVTK